MRMHDGLIYEDYLLDFICLADAQAFRAASVCQEDDVPHSHSACSRLASPAYPVCPDSRDVAALPGDLSAPWLVQP